MLMRHAKSTHDDSALHDIDRPLNKKGVQDSLLVGKFLKKSVGKPDLIVSSPAVRAKETTDGLIDTAELNTPCTQSAGVRFRTESPTLTP